MTEAMETKGHVAPFGTWASPITPEMVVTAGVTPSSPRVSGTMVYWLESRPAEGGRVALVQRRPDGSTHEISGPSHSVRTRVHEYGGGAYSVRGETVMFSNWDDQRLWRHDPGMSLRAVTPEPLVPASVRYADGVMTGHRLITVRESHHEGEVVNDLVAVSASGDVEVMASGRDFYSSPRLNADASSLAWVCWDHPSMPWDDTELWVATLGSDGLANPRRVAGGPGVSVTQPQWAPDGSLWYVSDASGWWNLHRFDGRHAGPVPGLERDAEFAGPSWVFGSSNFAPLDDGRIVCCWSELGLDHLGVYEPSTRQLREIPLPYSSFSDLVAGPDGRAVLVAASPIVGPTVLAVDPNIGEPEILRPPTPLGPDASAAGVGDSVSVPDPISFPTTGGGQAHALFYAPHNPGFAGPPGERPPLVVMIHGGPTSAARSSLSLAIQYWTSRGFAVVDVNHRGSTGYGRDFRNALRGRWGVVDVADCVDAAEFLAASGRVDGARMVIRGGSAGGFTTLCALAFHDVFAAGASYYGIADLELLARDTHKFEARYLDSLVGPYPEAREVYKARSPIHHADGIRSPVVVFQGLDDQVVPRSQAETLLTALRRRRVPHAYLEFPGEGHGFRQSSTIVRCLEAELSFYGQVLEFEPSGIEKPIAVEYL